MNAFRISMHYMLNSVGEYEESYSVDTDEYVIDELAFDDLVRLRDKLTTFINDLKVRGSCFLLRFRRRPLRRMV